MPCKLTMTSCPELTTAALPESDLDAATDQLFESIQSNFDRPSVLRLGQDSTIDVSRAETELRLLDLFAVYLAIKTTDCEKWKHVGSVLFERVCTRVLTWWAPAWDTQDDVIEVLKGRFAAYNRLAEVSGREDLKGMTLLVGVLCGAIIQGDRRLFADDSGTARKAFADVAVNLMEAQNLLRTVAAKIFKTRFNAVSELLLTLKRPALT
jgi:hypothetical protein